MAEWVWVLTASDPLCCARNVLCGAGGECKFQSCSGDGCNFNSARRVAVKMHGHPLVTGLVAAIALAISAAALYSP